MQTFGRKICFFLTRKEEGIFFQNFEQYKFKIFMILQSVFIKYTMLRVCVHPSLHMNACFVSSQLNLNPLGDEGIEAILKSVTAHPSMRLLSLEVSKLLPFI